MRQEFPNRGSRFAKTRFRSCFGDTGGTPGLPGGFRRCWAGVQPGDVLLFRLRTRGCELDMAQCCAGGLDRDIFDSFLENECAHNVRGLVGADLFERASVAFPLTVNSTINPILDRARRRYQRFPFPVVHAATIQVTLVCGEAFRRPAGERPPR